MNQQPEVTPAPVEAAPVEAAPVELAPLEPARVDVSAAASTKAEPALADLPAVASAKSDPALVADELEPQVEVAAISEKGPRDENQDWLSWVQSPRGELFIVADGMGGYKGGVHAARLTVQGIEAHLAAAPADWPFARALEHAVALTNQHVHQLANSGNPDMDHMGSTVVVAMVADGKLQVGHVGDSRAYLFRDGHLRLLTRDHTRVQQMVDAKMLTPRQARNHPEGHVLTRAVGSRPDVEIDVRDPIRLHEGDALLMCSDGLTGFVGDKTICGVLTSQPDTQQVPAELVAKALAAGGSDNVTIQFVRFGASPRRRWTVKLPPREPPADVRSASRGTGWPWRPLAAAAALAIIFAGTVLWGARPPELELTSAAGPGGEVVLRWSAPDADEVRIEPNVGLAVTPRQGTVRIAAPVPSPVTYKATATTKVMWWTLTSEDTVTIPPRSATATTAPGTTSPTPATPESQDAASATAAASKTAAPRAPAADPKRGAPRGGSQDPAAAGKPQEPRSESEDKPAPAQSVPPDPAAVNDDGD